MANMTLDRREIMKDLTLQIKVERVFGWLDWRKHVALFFFRFGARILGCQLELYVKD